MVKSNSCIDLGAFYYREEKQLKEGKSLRKRQGLWRPCAAFVLFWADAAVVIQH